MGGAVTFVRNDDVGARVLAPVLALGVAASVVATLPLLLIGPLSLRMSADLGLSVATLGSAVGIATLIRALSTVVIGPAVDHYGSLPSLRIALLLGGIASAGLALTARTWATLVPWLAVAGLAHAIMMPAVNRLMVSRIPPRRFGLAFGLKMTGPPIAMLIAGLSVPLLVVHIGWRAMYVLLGAACILLIRVVRTPKGGEGRRVILPWSRRRMLPAGRRRGAGSTRRTTFAGRGARALVGLGFVAEFVASGSILTFFVGAADEAGIAGDVAATVLAVASVLALTARIVGGLVCDRSGVHPLRLSSVMFAIGSVGVVGIASGRPQLMLTGAVVGLVGTWGFTNMIWIALMRAFPQSPGRATASMAWAILVGGGLGPIVFGASVEAFGYSASWRGVAAIAILGCLSNIAAARALPAPDPDQARATVD